MTTIILSHKIWVADTNVTGNGGMSVASTTKILRDPDDQFIVAAAGPHAHIMSLVDKLLYNLLKDMDEFAKGLHEDLEAVIVTNVSDPIHILNKRVGPFLMNLPYAFGSGEVPARAALLVPHATIFDAMKVAAVMDPSTSFDKIQKVEIPEHYKWPASLVTDMSA